MQRRRVTFSQLHEFDRDAANAYLDRLINGRSFDMVDVWHDFYVEEPGDDGSRARLLAVDQYVDRPGQDPIELEWDPLDMAWLVVYDVVPTVGTWIVSNTKD